MQTQSHCDNQNMNSPSECRECGEPAERTIPERVNSNEKIVVNNKSLLKKPNSLKVIASSSCDLVTSVETCHGDGSQVTKPISSEKKMVSFSRTPQERSKTIVDAPDCLRFMREGSEMLKVLPGRQQQYRRIYYWDPETSPCLRWQPSTKKPQKACIPLATMTEVRCGKAAWQTLRDLNNGGGSNSLASSSVTTSGSSTLFSGADSMEEARVLLIVHGSNCKNLFLVANSPEVAQIWFTGLSCLIQGRGHFEGVPLDEDQLAMRDRWLLSVFSQADAEKKGFLHEADVVLLLKSLNSEVATVRIRHNLKEADLLRSRTTTGSGRGRISSEDFLHVFKEVFTRPEIYFLLVKYSNAGDYLTVDDLHLFLTAEQGMSTVTRSECAAFIQQYEFSEEGKQKGHLGIDGFTAFLRSSHGDVLHPRHKEVWQDMTQPLPHYFIAASHRTFLLEDQLKGPSSVEGYKSALLAGCRFVEVECWDGADNKAIVYHGRTLTSQIPFADVIEVIAKFAFVSSEYPLIVSLNIHCGMQQQNSMANVLQQYLGQQLFTWQDWHLWSSARKGGRSARIDTEDTSSCWPSPWELRKRILLKTKCLAASGGGVTEAGYVTEEDEDAPVDRLYRTGCSGSGCGGHSTSSSSSLSGDVSSISCSAAFYTSSSSENNNKERIIKLSGQLSRLVSVLPSFRFREKHLLRNQTLLVPSSRATAKRALSTSSHPVVVKSSSLLTEESRPTHSPSSMSLSSATAPTEMSVSLAMALCSPLPADDIAKKSHELPHPPVPDKTETQTNDFSLLGVYNVCEPQGFHLANSQSEDLVYFCSRHLLRVYPSPARVDSSNAYPQEMWNCGCQLVCMNYQTPGLMMDLHRAMFSRNANCGYILKPAFLRRPYPRMGRLSEEIRPQPESDPIQLHIRIISVLHLPKPRASVVRSNVVEPFVVVEVFGLPSDCATVDDPWSPTCEQRTRTVNCQQNYCAIFEESFSFEIDNPEMVLVRFLVLDEDGIGDEFIGQASLPLDCMRMGYRHVQLKEHSGQDIPNACLFIHTAVSRRPELWSTAGRGHHLLKKRKHKCYPGMQKIGIASMDDLFKMSMESVRESVDLRSDLQSAMSEFRIQCGVSSISNVRQCMHRLAQRVATQTRHQFYGPRASSSSSHASSLSVFASPSNEQVPRTECGRDSSPSPVLYLAPQLETEEWNEATGAFPSMKMATAVQMPEKMKKCAPAFDKLVAACKKVLQDFHELAEKLQTKHNEAVICYSQSLSGLCESHHFNTRKSSRAMEACLWNVRLLSGQIHLLHKTRQDAADYLLESVETAHTLGLASTAVLTATRVAVQRFSSLDEVGIIPVEESGSGTTPAEVDTMAAPHPTSPVVTVTYSTTL